MSKVIEKKWHCQILLSRENTDIKIVEYVRIYFIESVKWGRISRPDKLWEQRQKNIYFILLDTRYRILLSSIKFVTHLTPQERMSERKREKVDSFAFRPANVIKFHNSFFFLAIHHVAKHSNEKLFAMSAFPGILHTPLQIIVGTCVHFIPTL